MSKVEYKWPYQNEMDQEETIDSDVLVLGGGLSGPASPGSVIAELMLTPKGCYFANIAGIAVAGAVSFAISVFLLKFFGKDASLAEAQAQVAASKAASKGQAPAAESTTGAEVDIKSVKKIVFACDAGMGSSAMGATMLRNKLKDAGITDIEVIHHPVSEIPGDCQIVVTHHELAHRAVASNPSARVIPIQNFMGAPEYDALVSELFLCVGVADHAPVGVDEILVGVLPAPERRLVEMLQCSGTVSPYVEIVRVRAAVFPQLLPCLFMDAVVFPNVPVGHIHRKKAEAAEQGKKHIVPPAVF